MTNAQPDFQKKPKEVIAASDRPGSRPVFIGHSSLKPEQAVRIPTDMAGAGLQTGTAPYCRPWRLPRRCQQELQQLNGPFDLTRRQARSGFRKQGSDHQARRWPALTTVSADCVANSVGRKKNYNIRCLNCTSRKARAVTAFCAEICRTLSTEIRVRKQRDACTVSPGRHSIQCLWPIPSRCLPKNARYTLFHL